MLKLTFNHQSQDSLRQVLCLGAHSDDIEIGCGGTILKLIETFPDLSFYWVVFGAAGARQEEALASANTFLKSAGGTKSVVVKGFRDSFFPYIGAEIKESFEQLRKEVSPDLILTHYRYDLHQDHRVISDLTWNSFRNHLILEYEIPKYDGDMGIPNIFVHLNESICQRKVNYLIENFATQSNKHWFSSDTFLSILRLRGIESNAPDKYAEAFYCRKSVLI
jgi:LmbE family N-acetylglucosaminyl deacetylase